MPLLYCVLLRRTGTMYNTTTNDDMMHVSSSIIVVVVIFVRVVLDRSPPRRVVSSTTTDVSLINTGSNTSNCRRVHLTLALGIPTEAAITFILFVTKYWLSLFQENSYGSLDDEWYVSSMNAERKYLAIDEAYVTLVLWSSCNRVCS